MNDLLPPHDPIEALGEAYELLLEKSLQKAHTSGALIHHMIDESRRDIVALNKFDDNEIMKVEEYLKRDITDAARYLDRTGNDLKFWLDFDVDLIKRELWDRFSDAADYTTKQRYQLNELAAIGEYHSGELAGLGTLICNQCGEKHHFHKPSRIPHCIKCHNTHFHRHDFE